MTLFARQTKARSLTGPPLQQAAEGTADSAPLLAFAGAAVRFLNCVVCGRAPADWFKWWAMVPNEPTRSQVRQGSPNDWGPQEKK